MALSKDYILLAKKYNDILILNKEDFSLIQTIKEERSGGFI
jgi:hypothetical protein